MSNYYQTIHDESVQLLRLKHGADMDLTYALMSLYKNIGKFILVSYHPVHSECDAIAFYIPYIEAVCNSLEECGIAETAFDKDYPDGCWDGYIEIEYPKGYIEEHVKKIATEEMLLEEGLPF